MSRWEVSLGLIVIGVRLAVFAYAGSPLPYYDQWLVEFNNTLIGILTGQDFRAFFDPHNEHMLVTTKILSLLGFYFHGYWDVSFLIICSAVVRALTAIWIFRIVVQDCLPGRRILIWMLCVLFFAVPMSAYNFLSGMQVSFFLADLGLLWSLQATLRWRSPLNSGMNLVAGSIFGLASMASAVAIPFATLAVHFWQKKARPGFVVAWIISALIAAAFVVLRRSTSTEFLQFTVPDLTARMMFGLEILAWPFSHPLGGVVMLGLLAFTLWHVVRLAAEKRTDAKTILLGIAVFALCNGGFIVAGRLPGTLHMRHWDTLALLPFALLAIALLLFAPTAARWRQNLAASLGMVMVICLGAFTLKVSWPYLKVAHESRAAAVDHYRELLLEQDLAVEWDRMITQLMRRDYSFFDDPIGRFSIHPIVLGNLIAMKRAPLTMLSPEILPVRDPSGFSTLCRFVIGYSWLLCVLGLGLLLTQSKEDLIGGRVMEPDDTLVP